MWGGGVRENGRRRSGFLKISQLPSQDIREALMDSQQANYVGSFAFFEAYAGRYVEHGVGRNWKLV